jgi:DNA repair protein RadC
MTAPELAAAADVPTILAERVVAARDLGSCLARIPTDNRSLAVSYDVERHLPLGFERYEIEVLVALVLSPTLDVQAVVLLAKGGGSVVSLFARDVFIPIVRLGARALVLVHNHPAGDPTPSKEDVVFTNKIASAGLALGIELIDHVIVAARGLFSFRDASLMPTADELKSDEPF